MALSKLFSEEMLEILKFMKVGDLIELCANGKSMKKLIEEKWRQHLTLEYVDILQIFPSLSSATTIDVCRQNYSTMYCYYDYNEKRSAYNNSKAQVDEFDKTEGGVECEMYKLIDGSSKR